MNIVDNSSHYHAVRIDGKRTQVIFKTGSPNHLHQVSRLQNRPHGTRPAAADQSHMAAFVSGQNIDDCRILTVLAGVQNEPVALPFHLCSPVAYLTKA
jgi:hypothetical protein